VICSILLFSCKKDIASTADLINANLDATSPNNNWHKVTSQRALYNLKTSINGKTTNNENIVLTQKILDFQKIVSSKNETVTNITLTNCSLP